MTTAKISIGQTIAKPAIQKRAPVPKAKARAGATNKVSSRYAKSPIKAQYEAVLVRLGLEKTPHARAPRELPQDPRCRSENITELEQGPPQGQVVVSPAAQEVEGGLAAAAPPMEKTAEEPKANTVFPITKPGAAGGSKRGGRGGRRGNGGGGRARHRRH